MILCTLTIDTYDQELPSVQVHVVPRVGETFALAGFGLDAYAKTFGTYEFTVTEVRHTCTLNEQGVGEKHHVDLTVTRLNRPDNE